MHTYIQASTPLLIVLGLSLALFTSSPVTADTPVLGPKEAIPYESGRRQSFSDSQILKPGNVGEPFDPPSEHAQTVEMGEGVSNWALGKPVTSSVESLAGPLRVLTDGDKTVEYSMHGSHHVELDHYCWKTGEKAFRVGPQFVQIDIQKEVLIVGVGIWCPMPHFGYDVPRDVVVQVSGDSGFGASTTTVFNCDKDNSLGLGAGSDRRFATSPYGKLIRVSNQVGRYVRIWFDGSARNDSTSRFVEIEVYGRPGPLAHRQEALRLPESYLWQDRTYIIGASALLLACIALLMLVRHIRKKNNKIASPPLE